MINRLSIENYALIEHSEVYFEDGLTVLTGETGAGKSIMLDALSLLLGARADSKSIGDKTKKTVVEAEFSLPDIDLKPLLEKNDIEWEDSILLIRRELSAIGKNRNYINDTPVNLTVLSEIMSHLLDIHTQHSNITLNDSSKQLAIIDAYAEDGEVLDEYKKTFRKYVELRNKIKNAKQDFQTKNENRDFIVFRLEQLEKIKPKQGELSRLEKEFEILNNSDRIKSELLQAYNLLDIGQVSAIKLLNKADLCLDGIDLSLLNEKSENIKIRLDALKIELRDIADTVGDFLENFDSDPDRLEKVKERIENIEDCIRRFKVKDEKELIELYEKLKIEYQELEEGGTDFTVWEKDLKNLGVKLKQLAENLSEIREKASIDFARQLEEVIKPLGLPNIRFEINVAKGKLSNEGQDKVTFYCSFNKNHKMEPIADIASGGEISRVMLGIKTIMAAKMQMPTIIFDEIDSGVSGEIAHKMGGLMKKMADNMQVLAVTHLPQVAASGRHHYKVYKTDDEKKTISQIRKLNKEERVKEIAAMMSGSEINEAAISNARVLLSSN